MYKIIRKHKFLTFSFEFSNSRSSTERNRREKVSEDTSRSRCPDLATSMIKNMSIDCILSKELYNITFLHLHSDVSMTDKVETQQIFASNTEPNDP